MTPEARFTKRVRERWKNIDSRLTTYKHSDRFHGGVADVELTLYPMMTAWIEFKFMKRVAKRRVAGVTELQKIYLQEHHEAGVPSYVLIGTNDGFACYPIDIFDGYVYADDIKPLTALIDVIHDVRVRYDR